MDVLIKLVKGMQHLLEARWWWVLVGGMALGELPVAAQDLHFTAVEWYEAENAPDVLPQVSGLSAPAVPRALRNLKEPAYLEASVVVDERGNQKHWRMQATHPWLQEAFESVSRVDLFWRPARRERRPVQSEIRFFLLFNPAGSPSAGPDAEPRVLQVVPPVHPRAAESRAPTEVAYAVVELDAAGKVLAIKDVEAPDSRYEQAARNAVRRWTFAPARAGGQPVPGRVRVPLLFVPPSTLSASELAELPRVIHQTPPVYPEVMHRVGLVGEVLVDMVVSVEGRVREAHVVRSTNPHFDEPALEAVLQWQFTPGTKEGSPVNVRLRVPVKFSVVDDLGRHVGKELFRVDGSPKSREKLPPEFRFDSPPRSVSTNVAVYPFELLQSRIQGAVTLNFVVGPHGKVSEVHVVKTAHPAFAEAARAMLDTYEFLPATKDGQPSPAILGMEIDFDLRGSFLVPVSTEMLTTARALTRESQGFLGLADLDAIPRALSQRAPVFPSALATHTDQGRAKVEFVIDREGRAQAPRMLTASHPAFGYAAVQAVATWRFQPPLRNGSRVEVRVQQEFSFSLRNRRGLP